eukprot:gene6434-21080_t
MADFSLLQQMMNQQRATTSAPLSPPNLSMEPWFVGATPQAQVEKALMKAPAGDFVIRESARTPGAFVMMVKLTATTGIQKRIFYKHGVYQLDGSVETYPDMHHVIRTEPMARRPARDLIFEH